MNSTLAASLAALALVAASRGAAPLAAQENGLAALLAERQKSIPGGRHAFEETWLLPEDGAAATAEATRFAGRVAVFQEAPRERIEIRPATDGALGDPIVIVSDGEGYHLVTRVGATPLAGSVQAGDPFVRLVLAGPAGAAPPHRVVTARGVAAVVLRSQGRPAFESDVAFELKLPQVGGGLLKTGLSSFSPAQNTQVTSAAGARGVGQLQTAAGSVAVTPDPAAVAWMDAQTVSPIAFEAFKRAVRLDPYDALPDGSAP